MFGLKLKDYTSDLERYKLERIYLFSSRYVESFCLKGNHIVMLNTRI